MEFPDLESRESVRMGFDFDAVEDEDLPYLEVCASVSNVDDPEMPALTFRMWIIGLVLCTIGSGLNVSFNFRQLALQDIPLVLVPVSYPIGKLAAYSEGNRAWLLAQPGSVEHQGACAGVHHGKHCDQEPVRAQCDRHC